MNERWALVLGGASCVWDDLREFEQLYGRQWDCTVIAVNDIAIHWPRTLHHWVSLHPNRFKKWVVQRGEKPMPVKWGRPARFDSERLYYDRELDERCGGSSGMFAVQVAKHIGCSRVVLCGVPMTVTPHFAESKEEFAPTWGSADSLWPAWQRNELSMRGWVRSMSGRTKELLGYPTRGWFMADVISELQSVGSC